jgi:hypothetical protein
MTLRSPTIEIRHSLRTETYEAWMPNALGGMSPLLNEQGEIEHIGADRHGRSRWRDAPHALQFFQDLDERFRSMP